MFGFFNTPTSVKNNNLRSSKMELMVSRDVSRVFYLFKSLFEDLEQLPAQAFQVFEISRIDDSQSLGQNIVMKSVVTPFSKIIIELRIVITRLQQSTPEMVIKTAFVNVDRMIP